MDRINPFIPTPPDYCCHCNTAHSIEIFNCYDKPLGLSKLLNFANNIADVSKITISRAHCNNCGQDYLICWDSNGVPITMDEPDKMNSFISTFHDFETRRLSEDEIAQFKAQRISGNS